MQLSVLNVTCVVLHAQQVDLTQKSEQECSNLQWNEGKINQYKLKYLFRHECATFLGVGFCENCSVCLSSKLLHTGLLPCFHSSPLLLSQQQNLLSLPKALRGMGQ